eukprot:CAMPEP_0194110192 /NCGR_PEP_ID=MMETSP0150-20130528/9499_1 /TAXON_ID=122233 /ORGANISM="Chaetoceros debilis, Strain MM31A-1" /LENGTH=811 /DNA_ID=CAMNT_0038799313 /DNA_START=222 /DNA_END=2654 /DNA_ORIENTATION=+
MQKERLYDDTARLGGVLASLSINVNPNVNANTNANVNESKILAPAKPPRHGCIGGNETPSKRDDANRTSNLLIKSTTQALPLGGNITEGISLADTSTPSTIDRSTATSFEMIKTPAALSTRRPFHHKENHGCNLFPYPKMNLYQHQHDQDHPSHVDLNMHHVNLPSPLETSPFGSVGAGFGFGGRTLESSTSTSSGSATLISQLNSFSSPNERGYESATSMSIEEESDESEDSSRSASVSIRVFNRQRSFEDSDEDYVASDEDSFSSASASVSASSSDYHGKVYIDNDEMNDTGIYIDKAGDDTFNDASYITKEDSVSYARDDTCTLDSVETQTENEESEQEEACIVTSFGSGNRLHHSSIRKTSTALVHDNSLEGANDDEVEVTVLTEENQNSDCSTHLPIITGIDANVKDVALSEEVTPSATIVFNESQEKSSFRNHDANDSAGNNSSNSKESSTTTSISRQTSTPRKSRGRTKWTMGTRIGEGSFGVVHVGMNNVTGKLMAVKKMRIPSGSGSSSYDLLEDLRREINLMKSFTHPNIVRYLGCEIHKSKGIIHIFQEWIPGGSVTSLLQKFGSFPLAVIRCYLFQILKGLDYLHSNCIIHRDIKGGNILVNDDGVVKLADFGASKRVRVSTNGTLISADDVMEKMTMRGTPYFMAPEVFQENYGTKADIWSCACVAHQMCTSNPPWKGLGLKSATSLYLHIMKHNGPPPLNCNMSTGADAIIEGKIEKDGNINNLLLNLLEQCFIIDPIERPSARLLLTHAFFNDYDPNESSMFGDESVTSSLIDARGGSIATPTSLSMFSPLKLAAW